MKAPEQLRPRAHRKKTLEFRHSKSIICAMPFWSSRRFAGVSSRTPQRSSTSSGPSGDGGAADGCRVPVLGTDRSSTLDSGVRKTGAQVVKRVDWLSPRNMDRQLILSRRPGNRASQQPGQTHLVLFQGDTFILATFSDKDCTSITRIEMASRPSAETCTLQGAGGSVGSFGRGRSPSSSYRCHGLVAGSRSSTRVQG